MRLENETPDPDANGGQIDEDADFEQGSLDEQSGERTSEDLRTQDLNIKFLYGQRRRYKFILK